MGEEHKTKGHRSDKPVNLTEKEIKRLRQFKEKVPSRFTRKCWRNCWRKFSPAGGACSKLLKVKQLDGMGL
jgi:hypothetical protein